METKQAHWQQLEALPGKIKALETKLVEFSFNLDAIQQAIADELATIEKAIADDGSLSNDQKRKAKRAELMAANEALAIAQADEKDLKHHIKETEINLNFIKNQFSVAKLKARYETAQLSAEF